MNYKTKNNTCADVFEMLRDEFGHKNGRQRTTDQETAVRPFNSRPLADLLPKKDLRTVTITYDVDDKNMNVTTPDGMTLEDMNACLFAACKRASDELGIDEKEFVSDVVLAFIKLIFDKQLKSFKKLVTDIIEEGGK